MLGLLKKFISNEWKGIKQALVSHRHSGRNTLYPNENLLVEKVTEENFPNAFKMMEEISHKSNVSHNGVFLSGLSYDTNAAAYHHTKKISIDRGNLADIKAFIRVYAHELGHVKYSTLHQHLGLGYLERPYKLLLSATTTMYGLGASAYMFLGENKILDGANWLLEHTGKYLAAAAITNAVLVRTREHMADLFAYNQTSLLPSVDVRQERNGILGNISKAVTEILSSVQSGYPTRIERDIVCKLLGGTPKKLSFVEQLNSTREDKLEVARAYGNEEKLLSGVELIRNEIKVNISLLANIKNGELLSNKRESDEDWLKDILNKNDASNETMTSKKR